MYAIVKDRNRQIRVEEGDLVLLDHLPEGEPGQELVLDEVCVLGGEETRIGAPLVEGARVVLEILEAVPGPKLVIGKFKRRKGYRRKTGFRAKYTRARVRSIEG